jgi:MoxR-like ATPase
MKMARARAAMAGRTYVIPDDVQEVAVPALGHRLILKPEYWAQDVTEDMVVREVLDSVPTPPVVPPTAP